MLKLFAILFPIPYKMNFRNEVVLAYSVGDLEFRSLVLFDRMMKLASEIQKIDPTLKLMGDESDIVKSFKVYDNYPAELQIKILDDFINYESIVLSSIKQTTNLNDDKTLLWAVLKKLNLRFDGDLFSNLEEDDVIEIYRNDNIQVFRNFRFHQICSYNYSDLFIRRWDELFQRDNFVTKQIQNAAFKIFSGEANGRLDLDNIVPHHLQEAHSPKLYLLDMKMRFFYPLKNKLGQVEYGLAVSKVNIVDKESKKYYIHDLNF